MRNWFSTASLRGAQRRGNPVAAFAASSALDCFAALAMTEEALMIARRWHGRVPAAKAQEYLALMRDIALSDYRSTHGNRGAWCLHRRDGDVIHVEMFTLWEDEAAIRRFAGKAINVAKYYNFDADFLLELEPEVVHFEVIA
jgi:hypothetical protein